MYKKLLNIDAVAIIIGAVLAASDYPAEAGPLGWLADNRA